MAANWMKIGLVIAAIAGLMLAIAYYQRRYKPHPEIARKLMHIGAGLVALSLPWLFSENWPVIILTVAASGGMLAVKYQAGLRDNLGAVTGSVVRDTLGEIVFPIGAGIIFVLADGDKLLYSIPILILTFADAGAALIGIFYGVNAYTTDDGIKTLEGSLTFFQAALLSTLVPILLFSEIGRAETLMIALLMALFSMLLDAVAWWGLDNLLIPVLSFLALSVFVVTSLSLLIVHFVVLVLLIIFAFFWRKRTTLNDSAALSTVIYGYLCWTLGGWHWVLPPAVLFLTYNVLSPSDVDRTERPFTVPVVLSVGAVGLFWLIVASGLGMPQLFYPYSISFAAQLAIIGTARSLGKDKNRAKSTILLLARSVVVSWVLVYLPISILQILNLFPNPLLTVQKNVWYGFAALAGVLIATALFTLSQSGERGFQNTTSRWTIQTLCSGLATLLGLAAVQLM